MIAAVSCQKSPDNVSPKRIHATSTREEADEDAQRSHLDHDQGGEEKGGEEENGCLSDSESRRTHTCSATLRSISSCPLCGCFPRLQVHSAVLENVKNLVGAQAFAIDPNAQDEDGPSSCCTRIKYDSIARTFILSWHYLAHFKGNDGVLSWRADTPSQTRNTETASAKDILRKYRVLTSEQFEHEMMSFLEEGMKIKPSVADVKKCVESMPSP